MKKLGEKLKDYNYEKYVKTAIDLKQLKEDLHDEKYRDYLKFIFQYRDEVIPDLKESKDNQKQLVELQELLYQTEINNFKTRRKLEINIELTVKLKRVHRLSIWGKIIGLILAVTGFYLWYNKVQKLLDEKIKLEINEIKKS